MASLLSKLLGPRAETTIPMPGRMGRAPEDGGEGATVTLWELGADEISDANDDAIRFLAKKYKQELADVRVLVAPETVDIEIKVQTLFRAMRDPSNSKQPFAAYDNEVRRLAPYDVQWLYERFLDHQAANSEYLSHKLEDLQRMVLEDLGKTQTPEDFWQRCDGGTARYLAMGLERKCAMLIRQIESLRATSLPSPSSNPSSQSSTE